MTTYKSGNEVVFTEGTTTGWEVLKTPAGELWARKLSSHSNATKLITEKSHIRKSLPKKIKEVIERELEKMETPEVIEEAPMVEEVKETVTEKNTVSKLSNDQLEVILNKRNEAGVKHTVEVMTIEEMALYRNNCLEAIERHMERFNKYKAGGTMQQHTKEMVEMLEGIIFYIDNKIEKRGG